MSYYEWTVLNDTWSYNWVRAALHVCRRWRDITSSDPLLWTKINTDLSTTLVKGMLGLSPHLKLDLFALNWRTNHRALLLLTPAVMSRTVTIDMSFHLKGSIVLPTFSDLPFLKKVELDSRHLKKIPLISPEAKLEALEHLRLTGFHWTSIAPILRPSLRTLQLRCCTEESYPSADELLGALNNMPFLENLFLYSALGYCIAYHQRRYRPVSTSTKAVLPHLKTLDITEDDAFVCSDMLSHIEFPANACLRVKTRGPMASYEELIREVATRLSMYKSLKAHDRPNVLEVSVILQPVAVLRCRVRLFIGKDTSSQQTFNNMPRELLDLDITFSVLFHVEDWKAFSEWFATAIFEGTSVNDLAEIQESRLVTNLYASILPFANRNWASHSTRSPLFDPKTLRTFSTNLARKTDSNSSQQSEQHSVCIKTVCLVHTALTGGPTRPEILKVSEAMDPELW